MPRRHGAARERHVPFVERDRPSSAAPEWSIPGLDVRSVSSEKTYRCPGCDHEIKPRLGHLVVIPQERPDDRRHWHTRCWEQELRRRGVRR
ncbi:MAG: hypothetical protein ABR600_03625 [Actinomycetota bacterium]